MVMSFANVPVPFHSANITVCLFMVSFISGPLFFEEMGSAGAVYFAVNGKFYESLLLNQAIPMLQQRAHQDRIIFLQISVLPHIVRCNCLGSILKMIESSAIIFHQPDLQDHLP